MLPTKKDEVVSNLRKLQPQAKLPSAAVLAKLSAMDSKLLRRRVTETVECVFEPSFEEPGMGDELMSPPSEVGSPSGGAGGDNDDSGVDLLTSERTCRLTSEQEQNLFRRLNYCRYNVLEIIRRHTGKRLGADAVAELLKWEHAAARTREELVRSNVPLVLAMAKRARVSRVDFADLVSEGNLALLRSVEKFDCARGYKVSTYACRAILKSFSRVASRAARYRGHFPTEFDPTLEKSDYIETKRMRLEDDCIDELRTILGKNLADLSDVEVRVIRERFALSDLPQDDDVVRGKTLEQVGMMIGVTKERVRQIQNKALGKLRHALDGGVLAV